MARLTRKKKIAFSIVTTLVFLVGLEGVCRLYFAVRQPHDVEDAVIDRFRPMRYDLTPNRLLPANGPMARINNAGLRGPDVEIPKRKVRVLCLGDSATFGYAPDVTDDKTYPAQLGAMLEAAEPGKYEVVNGGRPNFSTLDCLGFYSYRAAELQADIVVLMMGWNDAHLTHPLVRPPDKAIPKIIESSATLKITSLILGRFLKRSAPTPDALRAQLARLPRPTDGLSDQVFARDERALEDLARLCRARGSNPILVRLASPARGNWSDVNSLSDPEVVVMTPHLIGGELSPGGWARFVTTVNVGIDHIGERLGLPVVSASTLRDPDQFVDVCHPNSSGNEVLARAVADAVLQANR